MVKNRLIISFFVLLAAFECLAQTGLQKAAELHKSYRFDKSIKLCEELLKSADTKEQKDMIFQQMMMSENGQSMLMFSSDPVVVAKKKVPRKDFFLWFSHMENKGWAPDGNFYPKNATRYYYSEKGDIYTSARKDSLTWSVPEAPAGDMNSQGTEIYPVLSPDGKELYFSSNGLFGMGGYDLYVSRLDDSGRWGAVQNVGFPFSSTADDLLLTITPDNNYIIFASNRECDSENVIIYVVKYEKHLNRMVSQDDAPLLARLEISPSEKIDYPFSKNDMGTKPAFNPEPPKPKIDYTFRIEKESEIVQDNTLPKGIVYQVRAYTTKGKIKKAQLKGFCPVFEVKQNNGGYVYYIGLFRSYKEVSAALKTVKTKIPGAYAFAFENGKPLPVAKAREKESSITVVSEEVRIITE